MYEIKQCQINKLDETFEYAYFLQP
jgi:hypothetical protein